MSTSWRTDPEQAAPPLRTLEECVNVEEVMALGSARLAPEVRNYFAAAAGDGDTARDNLEAFRRRRLRPRVLTDLDGLSTATTVLGQPVPMPVGVAPTAEHGLAHPDGELATARGAAAAGVPYCLSGASTRPLAEVAPVCASPRWFQLYVGRDRPASEALIARAVGLGFEAIVLTVDVPIVGYRDAEFQSRRQFPASPHYDGHWGHLEPGYDALASGFHSTWEDLAWIIAACRGRPLVLKGVQAGADAELAVERGVAAVWVSNHGGRQLDRAPATLDVLDEVVAAVDGRAEVFVDGGVRRGVDVLTALALGARCVFVGRPVAFALAAGGSAGVTTVLSMLHRELAISMGLVGVRTIDEVGPSLVWSPPG
ncbi:MAG TPA: alpha-hydroxy acid oxidase [Acidimicrobiales bacterium]|nr:alpha-hydroxy acid oxidase [Acidimicrobiales bacterium]